MRVLLVTNDFPPRVGGIQSYLWNIYRRLPTVGIDVRVLAPSFRGDAEFDRTCGVEVVRRPGAIAWPTPALGRSIRELSRDADVVAFGAVLPMNLLDTRLDRAVVVHTHGFEVAWARAPIMRQTLRRIGDAASIVTVVSDFTRAFVERALGHPEKIHLLRTGVDLERFSPQIDATALRARYRLDERPVVACVSRLVARKGQDQIIKALPDVRASVPGATALLVGGGPMRARLEALARENGVEDAVVFAGEVPEAELATHYAAGDVFAMPCRSRYAGLEVEGLGLVYLEAQACARPAITGDSGGAPEAVVPEQTGLVVPGRSVRALESALVRLLGHRDRAGAMGAEGRRFVERHHRWSGVVDRYRRLLDDI
ncbi:MAG: glycosyltransferase family 4 protein [Actinomycetota bacterium]